MKPIKILDKEKMNQLPIDILRKIYSFGSVETKKLKQKAEYELITAFIRHIPVNASLTRPELDAVFQDISKCRCCYKHTQKRPHAAHLELILPYPRIINLSYECDCCCRHKLREITRLYANAW